MNDSIRRRLALRQYLTEVAHLSRVPISESDLLSLDDTRQISDQTRVLSTSSKAVWRMLFEHLKSDEFVAFVRSLDELCRGQITLWTPRSRACGCILLPSLQDVRFDFNFDLIPEGILSVVTRNLQNRLLLDFRRNAIHQQEVLIETYGPEWGVALHHKWSTTAQANGLKHD